MVDEEVGRASAFWVRWVQKEGRWRIFAFCGFEVRVRLGRLMKREACSLQSLVLHP